MAREAGLAARALPSRDRASRRRRRLFLASAMFFCVSAIDLFSRNHYLPVESQQAPSILILA
jgi:hypothetical protein